MADGLFLMQRYLGSDEEDSAEEETTNGLSKNEDLEAESLEPKKKKHKTSGTGTNEAEDTEKISDSHENDQYFKANVLDTKKKKFKTLDSEVEITENCPQNNLEVKSSKIAPESKIKKKKSKSDKGDHPEVEVVQIEVEGLLDKKENLFCPIGQIKVQNKALKPAIPKWMRNPTVFGIDLKEKEVPISEFPYLDENSKKHLKSSKVDFLFPVQLAVIPWLMESMQSKLRCLYRPSDLCVSAPTGSGKTLAFVLPIVQALKDRVVCAIRAVVVLPVSELAFQVYKVFKTFTQGTNLNVCILTGQKSFDSEQKILIGSGVNGTFSRVDIVVTTPGRILDHIHRTEGFSLEQLQYLVIDEADRMMQDIQKGWLKQVEDAVFKSSNLPNCVCSAIVGERMSYVPVTVCQTTHVNEPLQKLLFSATLFHDPDKLHALSLYKPKLFTAQVSSGNLIGKCTIPDDLTLLCVVCSDSAKPMALCHFIKENHFKKVLCFTESVERAQRLHLILAEMKLLQVREISSNNRPVQRKITLGQFAAGKVDILVCSDIVARGMDIEGVDCVVSYDIPPFVEAFVHRIGRTARAGKSGTAISLLTNGEVPTFKKMIKEAGISLAKEVTIEDKDLEQYQSTFQNSLAVADSKVKKIKSEKKQLNFGKKFGKRKLSSANTIPLKTSTMKTKEP